MIDFKWIIERKQNDGLIHQYVFKESFNENYSEWNDDSEEESLRVSDYLFDIHNVESMMYYARRNELMYSPIKVGEEFERDFSCDIGRDYLDFVQSTLTELSYSYSIDIENSYMAQQLRDFINEYENSWELRHLPDARLFLSDEEKYSSLFYELRYTPVLSELRNKFHSQEENAPVPYDLLEEMASEVSLVIRDRINILKNVFRYLEQEEGEHPILSYALDDELYRTFVELSQRAITNTCNTDLSLYFSVFDHEEGFKEIAEDLIKKVQNKIDGRYLFNKYRFNESNKKWKEGCFAALQSESGKLFIAFSGTFDACNKIQEYLCWKDKFKKDSETLLDNIKNYVIETPMFSGSELCILDENTVRYLHYCFFAKQTAEEAMKMGLDPDDFRPEYSCCERKMISKLEGDVNEKYCLFVRKPPCIYCQPAILDHLDNSKRSMKIFCCEDKSIVMWWAKDQLSQ